ncbi:hypothetical protein [Phaeodactylibacter xiamenensis]|uniref:hypothetical protein n=1 Tax=Phaeodactylibacter xiamenensis TaxID=1524460 RepID=UPI0024A9A39B|nr:hypothetical protein [Phaeodactylibacter xiamenensis]
MNPTERTPEELQWLKRAWLLANTNFDLAKSPGFEAHEAELKAFEIEWTKLYLAWKHDPIWDLSDACTEPGLEQFHPYEEAVRLIEEKQEHEWRVRRLKEQIKEANELGMSPSAAQRFLGLKAKVDVIERKAR